MNADRPESHGPLPDSKIGDRVLILTIVGGLLLTPPLADIFQLDGRILGIPVTAIYLFAVWGGLIAGAAALSRALGDSGEYHDGGDDEAQAGAADRTD